MAGSQSNQPVWSNFKNYGFVSFFPKGKLLSVNLIYKLFIKSLEYNKSEQFAP